jgi:hypothetical protein
MEVFGEFSVVAEEEESFWGLMENDRGLGENRRRGEIVG